MAPDKRVFCVKCNKNINNRNSKGIRCVGECGNAFHQRCVPMSDEVYAKFAVNPTEKWFCESCLEKNGEEITSKKRKLNQTIFDISDISDEEISNTEELVPLKKPDKRASVAEKIEFLVQQSFKLDEHSLQLNTIQMNLSDYQQRLEEQEGEILDLKNENVKLRAEMEEMRNDINHLKQINLAKNVEISGVLQCKDENLKEIVQTVGEKFQVNVIEDDISGLFRKKNGNIVLKLKNQQTCDKLIAASFNNKITNETIGIKHTFADIAKSPQNSTQNPLSNRIFINNQLTEYNQLIYKKLRDLKTNGKIFKLKYRNNSFAIKTSEKSKFFKNIYNLKQINEIK